MDNQLAKNLICFSHLRWDFVYQRPQHLMSRFALICPVYYIEEPIFSADSQPKMLHTKKMENLWVCVPHLPFGLSEEQINSELSKLVHTLLAEVGNTDNIFWYYTPMAIKFTRDLKAACTVYDCMDELSAFKFAPKGIKELEQQLYDRANVVFTGGYSLYEAKRHEHNNIHPFPSSIDREHFLTARSPCPIPPDQAGIEGFKIGFYGVLDERFDTALIAGIAAERPEWQIILIGPVVKIDPASLPQGPNIHYLGPKTYDQLPLYLSGWDLALIPFILNESTSFISPTKTPEYLTAGKPVVSTAIRDVVTFYGSKGYVHIGTNAQDFISIIDHYFTSGNDAQWLETVDELLADNSWDKTFERMRNLMSKSIDNRKATVLPNQLVDEKDH